MSRSEEEPSSTGCAGFSRWSTGVASPDTFERVFALLDPKGFERAFRTWVGAVIPALGRDQVIAIDGKTSRRTTSKAAAAPLHMVSSIRGRSGHRARADGERRDVQRDHRDP